MKREAILILIGSVIMYGGYVILWGTGQLFVYTTIGFVVVAVASLLVILGVAPKGK